MDHSSVSTALSEPAAVMPDAIRLIESEWIGWKSIDAQIARLRNALAVITLRSGRTLIGFNQDGTLSDDMVSAAGADEVTSFQEDGETFHLFALLLIRDSPGYGADPSQG